MNNTSMTAKSGMLYAVSAYATWGFVPLFWRELRMFPPTQILAHRIVWSLIFFVCIFLTRRTFTNWLRMLSDKKILLKSLPSGLAIGINWGLYIYAVNSGHALESSLGYFINPIFNVLIGSLLFKEKLNKFQWSAFSLACVGVGLLTVLNGRPPWIALALAGTFSLYGVIRKKTALKGTTGTAVESLLLIPAAILLFSIPSLTPTNLLELEDPLIPSVLLMLGGALTALPLVWFAEATQRLPLSTLGFFQYISPTFQFLIAVFIFQEPFDSGKLMAFSFIWMGLGLFIFDTARSSFQGRSDPSKVST
jgi:chloramphenicol-sensitive protein RarD